MNLFRLNIFLVLCLVSGSIHCQNRGFYDNNEFKRQRHELNFGIGTSNCLTDIGGNYSVSGLVKIMTHFRVKLHF